MLPPWLFWLMGSIPEKDGLDLNPPPSFLVFSPKISSSLAVPEAMASKVRTVLGKVAAARMGLERWGGLGAVGLGFGGLGH